MSTQKDYRLHWLAEKISNILGIFDIKFAQDLINEHSEEVNAFFCDSIECHADIIKQVIFLWRTFYDKMIEETITVLEEVRAPTPPPEKKEKKDKKKKKETAAEKNAKKIPSRPPSPIYVEVQVNHFKFFTKKKKELRVFSAEL